MLGTFGPLGEPSFALCMILVAALATPPLAAVGVLGVVRGPRAALVALAVATGLLAAFASGVSGQLSASAVTALGALAIGAALARLIPARWVVAGFVGMCTVDVALLAAGVGQPAATIIGRAALHVPGAVFDHAQVGQVVLDYPDLVLAAALGGFVAGQRGQLRAAALVTALAAVSLIVAPPTAVWPATIPVVMTLIALRTLGLPEAAELPHFQPEPATP